MTARLPGLLVQAGKGALETHGIVEISIGEEEMESHVQCLSCSYCTSRTAWSQWNP